MIVYYPDTYRETVKVKISMSTNGERKEEDTRVILFNILKELCIKIMPKSFD